MGMYGKCDESRYKTSVINMAHKSQAVAGIRRLPYGYMETRPKNEIKL